MKTLHPNRTLYMLFGIGALLVFLLGSAAWHVLIDGNSLDCSLKGVICLFIPDRSDWYIHLISYALMAPLMLALFLWFTAWRRQWARLKSLTRNLAALTIKDQKLETIARHLDLIDKVHLLDSNEYICFCACFASPRIYVSSALVEKLTGEELEALLLHEKYHLENYDPLKILLGGLIVHALFFIPVLRDLFRGYLTRKEIAADQYAICRQGHRRGIASALQMLLQRQSHCEASGFVVSGTEDLKHRINNMIGRKNTEKIPLSHIALSLIIPMLLITSIIASLTVLHS